MQMQHKRYECVLECAEPVAHHEETIGNEAILMRRKVRHNGGWAHVPIVTGDTMRHGMREAAAYALLDAAGILQQDGGPKLSEAALRLLFAGGMVTGKDGAGAVKLNQYRELCELVPSMALFGGCAENRVIPGRLIVSDATLICEESARYVPEWTLELAGQLDSCRSHVEEQQRVRMDPTLQPQKRALLLESAQVEANRRLEASETSSATKDAVNKAKEKSTMMPRRFERIAQGSLLSWSVEADVYNDLELDTFLLTLCAFLGRARVGGKRGTGHGLLKVVAGRDVEFVTTAQHESVDVTALAGRVGELFKAHVAERKERIESFLNGVNA
jgi:hypothetical protein